MTLQILTTFLAALLLAIGVVSLIGGPRRILEGAAIRHPARGLVFVVGVGVQLYRRYGGG